MRFGAKFFASPTGSRHLRVMKTSTNDDKYMWPSRHPEMVNGHFKQGLCTLVKFNFYK